MIVFVNILFITYWVSMQIKKRYVCGIVLIVVFIGLGIFALVGLESIINSTVLKSVWLDPQKVESWGQNPGKSGTLTLRNYTFFNLTNPHSFLYRNQTPTFHQINSYLLQQRTNFTNLHYSQDMDTVQFNLWLYFTLLDNSRNLDQEVYVLNVGPLGFWSQLQSTNIVWVAIQAFGGIYYELSQSLKAQAIGQGIVKQYLSNYSLLASGICGKIKLEENGCRMLWDDPLYGLSDQNNFQIWVSWTLENNTGDGITLAQYFGWTSLQLQTFNQIFKNWAQSMSSILQNWWCQGHLCSSYELMLKQMANSTITNNPPSGLPVESICLTGNVTCSGWPQIGAYYRHVFLQGNIDPAFQNLTFSEELMNYLFTPYTGVLLNIGNQSEVLKYGEIYDQNPENKSNLEQLRKTTRAESVELAVVVYKYFNYFVYNFAMKLPVGGSRKMLGLAQTTQKYMYKTFNKYYRWMQQQYLALLVGSQIQNCSEFIGKTIEGISQDKIVRICGNVSADSYREYYRLVQPCNNELKMQELLVQRYNLTSYQIEEYCDPQELSVLSILQQVHKIIWKQYNCSANKIRQRCTPHELTLMQFFNSTVSLNPIPNRIKNHTQAISLNRIDDSLPHWEYKQFLSVAYEDKDYDMQVFTYSQAVDLLSFDKLFSNPMLQNIFLWDNQSKITENFYWKNTQLLRQWIRYFMIECALGGLVQKRTVKELLFGYEDPFVKDIKTVDLMRGGDPSKDPTITLNEPNKTFEEAQKYTSSMNTGYKDPYKTRNFITKDNNTQIFIEQKSFTGYQIVNELKTPFKKWVSLNGTDGTQIKPLLAAQELQYIYIDSTKRISQMQQIQEVERFQLKAHRYQVTQRAIESSDKNPQNDIYYQKFKGFTNVSFKGAPLFISGNHFLRTAQEDQWAKKVLIYDEKGVDLQQASQFDRSELIVQARSGVLMTGTTYLQTNMYFQKDPLFKEQMMMPLFTVYRSGNMTEEAANNLFADLKMGLKLPIILLVVCCFGIVFTVMVLYWLHRKSQGRQVPKDSLLDSLDREVGMEAEGGEEKQGERMAREEDDRVERKQLNKSVEPVEVEGSNIVRGSAGEEEPRQLNKTIAASVDQPPPQANS